MTDQRLASRHGVFSAPEVAMLQRVMARLGTTIEMGSNNQEDIETARLILRMYAKGLCIENSLYEFCLAAAKYRKASGTGSTIDYLRAAG